MTETTMPATEAEAVGTDDERGSYELAFHLLPTVAEGEVPDVFAAIKDELSKSGAELFDEEAPERIDLAYEIVKHYEGKNRRFTSAYFGWIRFKADGETVTAVSEAVAENTNILRHLLIKLTRAEAAHPFRFHEALASQKMVTDVDEAAPVSSDESTTTESDTPQAPEQPAESGAADQTEIDKALGKSEV